MMELKLFDRIRPLQSRSSTWTRQLSRLRSSVEVESTVSTPAGLEMMLPQQKKFRTVDEMITIPCQSS